MYRNTPSLAGINELREVVMALKRTRTAPLVVTFAMRKGGTGKTTSAVNVSAALAAIGTRVLLCDFDAQGQSASFLGVGGAISADNDAQAFFTDRRHPPLVPVEARPGLWLFGGGGAITEAESVIAAMRLDIGSLAERLVAEAQRLQFDVVVIDTAPAGTLQELGFLVADLVVLAVEAAYSAVSMVPDTVAAIREVCRYHGAQAPEIRYLPTKRRRTADAATSINELAAIVSPDNVWGAVPLTVKVTEGQAFGLSVFEHAPSHEAAHAYMGAARAVLGFAEVSRA